MAYHNPKYRITRRLVRLESLVEESKSHRPWTIDPSAGCYLGLRLVSDRDARSGCDDRRPRTNFSACAHGSSGADGSPLNEE